ncbi:HAD family hydrolase [Kitasatospora sp. NPDC050543]|uniref:HAD family hydrolase n=1 Tax=Kitasatospora sp. NPDC050543 TaxID=3364054 RepID=UPI00379A8CDF
MQRLVLTDLDHTLIDRRGTVVNWATTFCDSLGLPPGAAELVHASVRARTYRRTFAELSATYGLAGSGEALWDEYVDGAASRVECFPGVLDALARLRAAGWTIAVVTNGATDVQRAKLAVTGLLDAVDAVCVSEEVCAPKPEPAIFHTAAARCGHHLSAGGWMIGNNPATDILGAQAVGLHSIWISPDPAWPHRHPAPDHTTPDATAAADLLLSL